MSQNHLAPMPAPPRRDRTGLLGYVVALALATLRARATATDFLRAFARIDPFFLVAAALRLAIAVLIIALIAGLFNFVQVAAISYDAARILFFVFLAFLVISILAGLFRRAG